MIVKIDKHTWVDPTSIVSLEYEEVCGYQSGYSATIITLSNGRKIVVREMKPEEIMAKINVMPKPDTREEEK